MEEKINIAEILKDKLRGIKLYSMIHGKCSFGAVTDEIFKINFCTSKFGLTQSGVCTLIKFGNMFDDGECIIFPSKEMRDWHKFAWKKGDVLVSNDGNKKVFFNGFTDDTYALFKAKHGLEVLSDGNTIYLADEDGIATSDYTLEDKDTAQTYINTIEERLGGKLNRETLEVKKPKFKDGDIVSSEIRFIDSEDVIVETYIVHNDYLHGEKLNYYVGYNGKVSMIDYNSVISPENTTVKNTFLRYATEEEKKQLFDALAKEGKAWNADKKMIIDLKPKWTPKPFDRVITRNAADDVWTANIFSHIDSHGEYVTIACVGGYTYCLPYNEETAKLIGTTNNWEG
mgnify:CR=1 FL=1